MQEGQEHVDGMGVIDADEKWVNGVIDLQGLAATIREDLIPQFEELATALGGWVDINNCTQQRKASSAMDDVARCYQMTAKIVWLATAMHGLNQHGNDVDPITRIEILMQMRGIITEINDAKEKLGMNDMQGFSPAA